MRRMKRISILISGLILDAMFIELAVSVLPVGERSIRMIKRPERSAVLQTQLETSGHSVITYWEN